MGVEYNRCHENASKDNQGMSNIANYLLIPIVDMNNSEDGITNRLNYICLKKQVFLTVCVILGISYVPNVTIFYSMYCIFMYTNSE